jgi:hypothetical protein
MTDLISNISVTAGIMGAYLLSLSMVIYQRAMKHCALKKAGCVAPKTVHHYLRLSKKT